MGESASTVSYGYTDPDWGDLLTSYNGNTITYDEIGNPLSDGTWSYTWQHGRQLASMSKAEETWSFTYNADGLRTQKTNGTTTYNYTYNGSSLSQMTVGSDTLRFFYDANGVPVSVDYNGTTYYYATNIQGDVMAILDANGTEVARYVYDAWGRNLAAFGTLQDTLGTHNPLRYRGYVYDVELKLYYLQSRYYNPYTGRFINSDVYSSSRQGLQGYNMHIYCLNNPVKHADYNGLDAIVLWDDDGLGHTGIMAQDENGVWWHFYWGASSTGSSYAGSSGSSGSLGNLFGGNVYTKCVPFYGETTLSAINQSGMYSSYEHMEYLVGDFSQSVDLMKNAKEIYKKYDLFSTNCNTVSYDILAQSDTYFSPLLYDCAGYIRPHVSFLRLRQFKTIYNMKYLIGSIVTISEEVLKCLS